MDAIRALDIFIEKIDMATDPTEVFELLRAEVERRGFSIYTYWLMIGPEDNNPTNAFWVTSYPKEWTEHYLKEDYGPHDLVVRQSAVSGVPFLWSDLKKKYILTPTQKLVFDDACDIGIRGGATVPIRGPGKAVATFSVASQEDDDLEFAKHFKAYRHELHMIATYAHERLMQFGIGNYQYKDIMLTAREIEVLTWAAAGKTNEEVGIILSISAETVKTHISNICRKFDVYTKAHAISIAVSHGIIQVTPEFSKKTA